jgi:uncharacterized protein YrrD
MRADALKGRAVVTLADAARVGHVDDVLFDASYRTVLGFLVKSGAFHQAEGLPRPRVRAIGADAITVDDHSAVNSLNRFPELEGAQRLSATKGAKVVTEGGVLLGVIGAIELDESAERALAYTLDAPLLDRMRGRALQISVEEVSRVGGVMIVPDAVAERLHLAQA